MAVRLLRSILMLAAMILLGCGAAAITEFPDALTAPDGQPILLDDVDAILDDDNLSDAEKREQLRELGIEDEKLIDALLMG
jgi:hypothetical protein